MEKLSKRLLKLNKISKNILKYGVLVILVFFIISSVMLKKADNLAELTIAREFISGNVYALCELVMGSIMIDMFMGKEI